MTVLFLFLLGLFAVLLIPSLIVIFWKRKPVLAFTLASFVVLLSLSAPGIIQTFQAMMIYGAGDSDLMAGGISEAILGALFGLPIVLPLLAIIQWAARRRYKRKMGGAPKADIFT